jgi:hypothetical protein
MRRREFVTLLGSTAVAWPFAARAQQPTVPVIGTLVQLAQSTVQQTDQSLHVKGAHLWRP